MRPRLALWLCSIACGPTVAVDDASGSATDGSEGTTVGETSTSTSTSPGTSTTTTTTSVGSDSSESTGATTKCVGDCEVDVLFVIDNSSAMGQPQLKLAQAMAQFETLLAGLGLDVQVMFTTTDYGNPLCTLFQPEGYEPARGAPIASACSDRLDWFTGVDPSSPEDATEVCTAACQMASAPIGDPFVAFGAPDGSNVDQDGDGTPDSTVAHALSCLAPMGISGCGFESPLETMLQALNPDAMWNQGRRPFLRDDAMLAIVHLTNETDCSIRDFGVVMDPTYWEIHPDTGTPQPSSALCWNAGMTCDGPDASGVYMNCEPLDVDEMQPVERYTSYLADHLRINLGKEVVMLGIVGVPATAGGVADLVYRTWVDGVYPAGDILPEEAEDGVTADDKEFEFGIGPGCTAPSGEFFIQATPPGRLREVCEALDLSDNLADQRCCLESVCDDDYTLAIACLGGLIENAL